MIFNLCLDYMLLQDMKKEISVVDNNGNTIRYRTGFNYYDNECKFYIEKSINGGKFIYQFGGLSNNEVDRLLDNPSEIERTNRYLIFGGLVTLVIFVLGLFMLL